MLSKLPKIHQLDVFSKVLIDQLLVSATNFSILLFFSRQMEPIDFGWFALVWTLLFFFQGLGNATILMTHSIHEAPIEISDAIEQERCIRTLSALFSVIVGIILAFVALGVNGGETKLGLALFSMFTFGIVQDQLRRALLLGSNVMRAIYGDIVRLVAFAIAGSMVLHGKINVDFNSACLIIASSSAISVFSCLNLTPLAGLSAAFENVRKHRTTIWMLAAQHSMAFAIWNGYLLAVGSMIDITTLGQVRAVAGVAGVTAIFTQAIESRLLIEISKLTKKACHQEAKRLSVALSATGAFLFGLILLSSIPLSQLVLSFVSKTAIPMGGLLLTLFILANAIGFFAMVLGSTLQGFGRVKTVTIARMVMIVTMAAGTAPLVWCLGTLGAPLSLILCSLAFILICIIGDSSEHKSAD